MRTRRVSQPQRLVLSMTGTASECEILIRHRDPTSSRPFTGPEECEGKNAQAASYNKKPNNSQVRVIETSGTLINWIGIIEIGRSLVRAAWLPSTRFAFLLADRLAVTAFMWANSN
jgi:hypothetical protein